MEVKQQMLVALEQILTEFYDFKTTNERKRQIEVHLKEFENQTDSWKECCYYLENTSNSYVCMFCLISIETVVIRKWMFLSEENKNYLRTVLQRYVISQQKAPVFVRNKVVKLIVDTARSDWPHSYPSFFSDIVSLLSNSDTIELGLLFLRTASEELINPREDLCTDRKDELKRLFLSYIPQLFSTLANSIHSSYNSGVVQYDLANMLLIGLAHLFSWVPLSDAYSSQLLSLIYLFTKDRMLRVPAMLVINEILYKNCVPEDRVYLILNVCQKINQILCSMLEDEQFHELDTTFIYKILEAVRLILSTHWHRIEASGDRSPIEQIMLSLIRLTFQIPDRDQYYDCLNIWCTFLEYLKMRSVDHIAVYRDLAISLMRYIVEKLHTLGGFNTNQIDDYDDCENEEQNEFEVFIKNNVNVLEKIGDILPNDLCSYLIEVWHTTGLLYGNLLSASEIPSTLTTANAMEFYKFGISTRILVSIRSFMNERVEIDTVANLINVTIAANRCSLHSNDKLKHLSHSLNFVHCELLSATVTWLPNNWFRQQQQLLLELLSTSYPFVLDENIKCNSNLQLAFSRLISYLIETVNVGHYLQPLLVDPSFKHLQPAYSLILQCALCNWVLTRSTETVEERMIFLSNIFKIITLENLSHLDSAVLVIQSIKPRNAEQKRLLTTVLQPWMQQIVETFPNEMNVNPIKCVYMILFYLECFRSLRECMTEFLQKSISTFVTCFSRPFPREFDCSFEKLIQLLKLILETPGVISKQFVPTSISLCLHYLHSSKLGDHASNIKLQMFELLSSILVHKWQYFFNGGLLSNNSETPNADKLEEILEAILESLRQADITIFAYNLQCLEKVNERWKLYQKPIFKDRYIHKFQLTLLNTLIAKSHDLLSEQIEIALFHMACIDFPSFFNSFMFEFIKQVSGLDDNQRNNIRCNLKQDTDQPSFQMNMSRLVNDIRCFKTHNGVIP